MTYDLSELVSPTLKHKEQVTTLTKLALNDAQVMSQVMDILKTGKDVDRGTAAEVLKFVSQEAPAMLEIYIDDIVELIDYRAPRVRWGCPEAIGHLSKKYPDRMEKAIPKLLKNLEDNSTVVRWCAAFALTEIAKSNPGQKAQFLELLPRLIESEKNNGVRNLYVKANKSITK